MNGMALIWGGFILIMLGIAIINNYNLIGWVTVIGGFTMVAGVICCIIESRREDKKESEK